MFLKKKAKKQKSHYKKEEFCATEILIVFYFPLVTSQIHLGTQILVWLNEAV